MMMQDNFFGREMLLEIKGGGARLLDFKTTLKFLDLGGYPATEHPRKYDL